MNSPVPSAVSTREMHQTERTVAYRSAIESLPLDVAAKSTGSHPGVRSGWVPLRLASARTILYDAFARASLATRDVCALLHAAESLLVPYLAPSRRHVVSVPEEIVFDIVSAAARAKALTA